MQLVKTILLLTFVCSVIPSALAAKLPTEDEIKGVQTACGGGSVKQYNGDISAKIELRKKGAEAKGSADIKDLTALFGTIQNGPSDTSFQTYTKCILDLIKEYVNRASLKDSTMTIENWPTGGWDVVLTNPTQTPMYVTQAMLTGKNPNDGKPGMGFTLIVMVDPGAGQGGNIPAGKATWAHIALFGPPALCNNWRAIRNLLFDPNSDFKNWPCQVELNLVSTSGERAAVSEVFQCSRIPVPPPQC
jgi:hypothetical protein